MFGFLPYSRSTPEIDIEQKIDAQIIDHRPQSIRQENIEFFLTIFERMTTRPANAGGRRRRDGGGRVPGGRVDRHVHRGPVRRRPLPVAAVDAADPLRAGGGADRAPPPVGRDAPPAADVVPRGAARPAPSRRRVLGRAAHPPLPRRGRLLRQGRPRPSGPAHSARVPPNGRRC